MNVIGCAVAKVRNAETQHWRGLLRDCAIARLARHVRVMRVGVVCIVRELLHIMRESATAQPRNYLCMVRVVVLRTRATAQLGFSFERRKGNGKEFVMAQSKEEVNRKARERMAAYRQTPEYLDWLLRSRDLRRALKEKYRRQKGVAPRGLAKAERLAKQAAARTLREEKSHLHDAHVWRYAGVMKNRENFAKRWARDRGAVIARVSAYKARLPDAYVAQQLRAMGIASAAVTPALMELKREAMQFGRLAREAKKLINNQRKEEHETVTEHA